VSSDAIGAGFGPPLLLLLPPPPPPLLLVLLCIGNSMIKIEYD